MAIKTDCVCVCVCVCVCACARVCVCNKVLNFVLPSSIQLIYELWPRRHNRSVTTKVNTTNEYEILCLDFCTKILYSMYLFSSLFVCCCSFFEARLNKWNFGKIVYQISIFPPTIRYDTIYRYQIDISICSTYRSSTTSQPPARRSAPDHMFFFRHAPLYFHLRSALTCAGRSLVGTMACR